MACLVVTAWTWVIAVVSLSDSPGWALVFAAIGGFAMGTLLMIAVYEDQQRSRRRRQRAGRGRRLTVVREGASNLWGSEVVLESALLGQRKR